MTISAQLQQLSNAEFWGLIIALSVGSVVAFYFAFRWFLRSRIIDDVPTARIRAAHQGYVELDGNAQNPPDSPLIAPLSGSECCWYRFKIEKEGDKNWRTVESDTSDTLFQLDDGTGVCHIDPEGAEVTPSHKQVWTGSSRYPRRDNTIKAQPQTGVARFAAVLNTDLSIGGRYRYTEELILEGEPIYVIGQFQTVDYEAQRQNRDQEVRQLLRQWKQDRAYLLQRFDLNRDGEIDPNEWTLARRAAKQQIEGEHRELSQSPEIHLLSATHSRRHPFLISTLPQFDLARRYQRMAGFATLLFFVAGGLAVWALNTRIS